MLHPFYFCNPSVPHIVTWGSESHFRHEHTRCHPPRPPHPLCCCGSLGMWPPLQQQVHVHDKEPEERPSTTREASLSHCLPRLSPFNETSKHRWWQTKTPLSEDPSGVPKRLSPHPKLCMWVCTVFWKWLFCLELIYCMCRITKKKSFSGNKTHTLLLFLSLTLSYMNTNKCSTHSEQATSVVLYRTVYSCIFLVEFDASVVVWGKTWGEL